ncbi:uncharacterized protein [Chelonus insularis]|uniref:uncharacterized protein n=1 Tax=Chelonus insularis TaxID=460826 RepID=UPI00158EABA4|nr:uncharacterized protein LOC118066648 [Chelonus insularis]
MPRKYISKNVRSQWSSEDLKAAAKEVLDKKSSLGKIAEKYNISARTLRRRIEKNNLEKMKLGRRSSLGDANETKLVNYIKKLESIGYSPLTREEVRMLAFEFVIKNGIAHRFNMEKKEAGYDWLMAFLKRHPELSVYQNQTTNNKRKDKPGKKSSMENIEINENETKHIIKEQENNK